MRNTSDAFDLLLASPQRPVQPVGYKPSFANLERVYQTYVGSQDLREGKDYKNECAVRLSIALSLSGFSFESFSRPSRVHTGGRSGIPITHVYGANELATYLRQVWEAPEQFRGRTLGEAANGISGRSGIIYFNDCFRRTDGTKGDHIDLWSGARSKYYNQILGIGAGAEDPTSSRSLFRKADAVWFWQLP